MTRFNVSTGAVRSSPDNSPSEPRWTSGATSKCPLLYGNRFKTTTEWERRQTRRFSRSSPGGAARPWHRKQPVSPFSGRDDSRMYCARQGAQSLSMDTQRSTRLLGQVSRGARVHHANSPLPSRPDTRLTGSSDATTIATLCRDPSPQNPREPPLREDFRESERGLSHRARSLVDSFCVKTRAVVFWP